MACRVPRREICAPVALIVRPAILDGSFLASRRGCFRSVELAHSNVHL